MARRRPWIALGVELGVYLVLLLASRPAVVPALRPWLWLAMPIAALTMRCGLVLASFAMSVPLPDSALSFRARAEMMLRECGAFLRFQRLIMAPAGPSRFAPKAGVDPHRPLLVLLHGFYCSGDIFRPIAQTLADRTGCEVLTPSLPRVTAPLSVQLEDFAAWLRTAANDSRRIVVIGHSLGAVLALRYILRAIGPRIARLICIGAPHRGSALARFVTTPIGRDLRESRAEAIAPSSVVNIHAVHDNLVVPAANSVLAGARNVPIAACGHMSLIYCGAVVDIIVDAVDAERSRVADSR